MSRPFRSTLSLLLICALLASSCRGWSVQDTPPVELLKEEQPSSVRLFQHDGKQVVLMEPEIVGDSIRGYGKPCATDAATGK